MAHVMKVKAENMGMMRHCFRENSNYKNENIRHELTDRNIYLNDVTSSADLKREMEKRLDTLPKKPRKDAVLILEWVLTAPKDLPKEKERDFWRAAVDFFAERYGEENLIGAEIHMDETTPHMHTQIMPFTKDGRLSAKDVLTRTEMRTFHPDLQAHMDKALGIHVTVLADDDDIETKLTSKLNQKELTAAKEKIREQIRPLEDEREELKRETAALAARKESLQQDVAELEDGIQEYAKFNSNARGLLTDVVEAARQGVGALLARTGQNPEAIKSSEIGLKAAIQRLAAHNYPKPLRKALEGFKTLLTGINNKQRKVALASEIVGGTASPATLDLWKSIDKQTKEAFSFDPFKNTSSPTKPHKASRGTTSKPSRRDNPSR